MEMRGLMGGLYKISEWIMRLSVTNLLWIICSIPYIFLLFPTLLSQTTDEFLSGIILSSIVAPFTLFPATAAMFGVARKWVTGEVDVPLLRTFFRNYKESYLQSMIGGIVYVILFAIMIVDFQVYLRELTTFKLVSYLFIALIVLLGVSLFNFFSMVVHYHMKTFQLLKNSVLLTIGRPFHSLSTAVMCGFVLYISFSSPKLMFLVPFFTGSIVAIIAFWNFYRIYTKLQDQAARAAEEAEEAARLELEDAVGIEKLEADKEGNVRK